MSWHRRILPHVEQHALWDEAQAAYRQNPNFLAPHPGVERAVGLFGCPSDARTLTPQRVGGHYTRGLTAYLGVAGRSTQRADGTLFGNSGVRFADITDGASNTLLLGERPPSADMVFGWWYAGWGQDRDGDADMILGVRALNTAGSAGCLAGPYRFTPSRFGDPCGTFRFWSPHAGGAVFAFADGSARLLTYGVDNILPALASRDGGESVSPD